MSSRIYISSANWTYPVGTKKAVYVVSNCEDVELFVNGVSKGHAKASTAIYSPSGH